MKMTGSKIVLETLKKKGVTTVFGYPGGSVIPLFDALYDEKELQVYRPAHEQNGVHAADGYARTSGKLGVFIATAGPGATNTVTGMATAFMDSVPILVITAQVPEGMIGTDAFQEIDITGISLSITKDSFLVKKIENLQETLEKAMDIAVSGRPGPVLIDIPKNILLSEFEFDVTDHINHEKAEVESKFIQNLPEAIDMINHASRPLIYAGGGIRISHTEDLLVALAEKSDIPVVNSFMGLGTIPRSHRLSLGFIGMHGSREANLAVAQSDLILAIGVRFSDRGISQPSVLKSKLIHVDIDETEINKNIQNCMPLVGDFKQILPALINGIERKHREDYLKNILKNQVNQINEAIFSPENILKELNHLYHNNTILVTDVGQHQMWAGQYWNIHRSDEFVTSGGLGTMGYGLGAAIGAKIAHPEKEVVLITGDGSFHMNCNEMQTIARYALPIKIVLLNNAVLGMVYQWQRMFQNKRYSQTDNHSSIKYDQLARAYGFQFFKAEDKKSLVQAIDNMSKEKGPILLECVIDQQYGVYPIIPSGAGIDEFLTEG